MLRPEEAEPVDLANEGFQVIEDTVESISDFTGNDSTHNELSDDEVVHITDSYAEQT